jgi:Fur family ferric uptake transcriptional regulator
MMSARNSTPPFHVQQATRIDGPIAGSSGKDLMQTCDYSLEANQQCDRIQSEMIATNQNNSTSTDTGKAAANPQSPIQLACARLRAAGLRITQPRIAILAALIKRGQPTTIEQIHADLDPGSCDLVTVYRCLSAFEDIGLVRRSFFHNGTSLYAMSLGDEDPYHVICKETNAVQEIDPATTADLRRNVHQIEELLKSRGYNNVTHVVEFFGLAPQARGSAPESTVTT